MPKRYTDTEIWKKQRWFKKLSPEHKLAFFYIKDNCDHAGIWKIDCLELMEDTGLENFNLIEFSEAVNTDFDIFSGEKIFKERLKVVQKHLWITSLIQFQQEGKKNGRVVNATVPAVKSALQILDKFGLLQEALDKGIVRVDEGFRTLSEFTHISLEGLDKGIERDIVIIIDNNNNSINSKEDKNSLKIEKGKKEKKSPKNRKAEKEITNLGIRPKPEDLPEHPPPQSVKNVIRLVKVVQSKELSEDEVNTLWTVFKESHLSQWYPNTDGVYSHFQNWTKTQKFQTNARTKTDKRNHGSTMEFD